MKFTIRDLLWLTVVVALGVVAVALGVGWYQDRSQLQAVMKARDAELDFMATIANGNKAEIQTAVERYFVVGSPAKNYQSIISRARVLQGVDARDITGPSGQIHYTLGTGQHNMFVLIGVRGDLIVYAGTARVD